MGSFPPHEDLSTEELFRRFAPFVARFLYRVGVRSDGLDDVVQEVFLVVHRRGGYKAGPAKPTSYLATIAANAASAYRRRQRIDQARSSDTEVERLVSTNDGPVQVLEVTERLRLLQAALDRLAPDFRNTLVLADIEGESCASIAASFGVPTGTVYWRLHEARKRFQRALRAEKAGIPAAPVRGAQTSSERRERASLLALALNPLWFLSEGRRLLRHGAAQPPIHYDVRLGLAQHRHVASSMASPSWAPPEIASAAGHASTGIGVVGVTSAATAAAVVVVAGLLHSTPRADSDDRAAAQTVAPRASQAAASAASDFRTAPAAAPSEPSALREPSASSAFLGARDERDASAAGARSPAGESATAPSSARSRGAGTAQVVSGRSVESPMPRSAPTNTSLASNRADKQPTVAPEPSVAVSASSDTQIEAREIAQAERMLSSNPAGALVMVRQARARFKPSFLPEERDYVEVMALQALGRSDEAKTAATRFLSAYPGSAFSNRVRKVAEK